MEVSSAGPEGEAGNKQSYSPSGACTPSLTRSPAQLHHHVLLASPSGDKRRLINGKHEASQFVEGSFSQAMGHTAHSSKDAGLPATAQPKTPQRRKIMPEAAAKAAAEKSAAATAFECADARVVARSFVRDFRRIARDRLFDASAADAQSIGRYEQDRAPFLSAPEPLRVSAPSCTQRCITCCSGARRCVVVLRHLRNLPTHTNRHGSTSSIAQSSNISGFEWLTTL